MRNHPAVHRTRRRHPLLRSALLVCLVCALLLSVSSSFADPCVHYMDNVMPGDLVWEGRIQPTETEAGYSGDGYCPFCHALCETGYSIPPLGGGDASGSETPSGNPDPAPADPPAEQPVVPASEPDPQPAPAPEPAVLPPDNPAPAPAEQPILPPSEPAESNAAPAKTESLPYVPPSTDSTGNAPAADQGGASSGGSSSGSGAESSAPASSGGSSGASDGSGSPSSGSSSPANARRTRDLKRFPIFSSRFPYRRLRLYVPPELRGTFRAEAVGILLWPLPESNDSSTPLNSLLGN